MTRSVRLAARQALLEQRSFWRSAEYALFTFAFPLMILLLIGVVRLVRAARVHWEPVSLVTGGLLMVIGFVLPGASVAFFPGMMVLLIALLKGIRTKGRAASPAADCWQWRG